MKRGENGDEEESTSIKKLKLDQNFKLEPKVQFDGPFPYFRQPKQLGCFSQDSNRTFKHDNRSLRYLCLPKRQEVSYPIWQGLDNFISRDESIKEYIDHLLQWILLNKKLFAVAGQESSNEGQSNNSRGTSQENNDTHCQKYTKDSINTDFVCWRGLLTRLLCTPFENRDGWKISCCLFNGTIYMCEFDTDEKIQQKETQTEVQKTMTYGGWKFEQYLCTDVPGGLPDVTAPVNNNEAYCSVVRSRLQQHSLVYGGEVDCSEDADGGRYVELKTSRQIYNQRQDENFKRFKLIKWWAQSFLVGIPKIICGFRNDEGIVERLETFKTLDIPKLCKNIRNSWDANVCFNFLDSFLSYIKQTVTEDNPRVVYLFEWKPRQDVQCNKQKIDSEYTFLPNWYYNAPKNT